MSGRILFKATAAERHIDFQLTSLKNRKYRHVYIPRTSIIQLEHEDMVLVDRIHTLAVLIKLKRINALHVIIYWPDEHEQPLTGNSESVYVPYSLFMDFYRESMQLGGPVVWKALDMDYFRQSKFVFEDKAGLHQCLNNTTVRKKLVRYLRDNFYGGIENSEYEIHFCRHPIPYSFMLRVVSSFPTYVQELVLRGQQDLSTAQYWLKRIKPEILIPGIKGGIL